MNLTEKLKLKNKDIEEQHSKLVHNFVKKIDFKSLTKEINVKFGEFIDKLNYPVEEINLSFQVDGDDLGKFYKDSLYNISDRVVANFIKSHIENELDLMNVGNFELIKTDIHHHRFYEEFNMSITLSLKSVQWLKSYEGN